MTSQQRSRKERALSRLEAQLKSGVKTKKGTEGETVPLSERDVKRINKEISILKEKLKKS